MGTGMGVSVGAAVSVGVGVSVGSRVEVRASVVVAASAGAGVDDGTMAAVGTGVSVGDGCAAPGVGVKVGLRVGAARATVAGLAGKSTPIGPGRTDPGSATSSQIRLPKTVRFTTIRTAMTPSHC